MEDRNNRTEEAAEVEEAVTSRQTPDDCRHMQHVEEAASAADQKLA